MIALRRIGFVLLAIAGVAVWYLLAPDTPDLPNPDLYESVIGIALDDYDANAARTESAPQQQVVNGWVAKDLLSIMARQNTDLLRAVGSEQEDQRVPALLGLIVLALAWNGITTVRPGAPSTPGRHTVPTDSGGEHEGSSYG